MTAFHRSSPAQSVTARIFAAIVMAVLVLSSAAPAYAAPRRAGGKGVATYTVIPTPTEITLCPGQSDQIAVRVSRQVTNNSGAKPVVGRPKDLTRAKIGAVADDPGIASIAPEAGRAVPLTFRAGGRSPNSGAWFTVRAQKPGDTHITFSAMGVLNPGAPATVPGVDDDLAPLGNTPTATVIVHVRCNFRISLSSTWTISGERSHDALGVVSDVGLAPDASGNFGVDATMRNHAGVYGLCTGSVTVQESTVRFNGHLSPAGVLHIDVVYGPVKHTSAEGCKGKSQTGAGVPQTLSIDVDVSTGQHHFFLQLPHTMDDDAGAIPGDTVVYVTVAQ